MNRTLRTVRRIVDPLRRHVMGRRFRHGNARKDPSLLQVVREGRHRSGSHRSRRNSGM